MIKVILFDCDGLIIRHEKYFSVRLAEKRGEVLEEENAEQKAFFKGIFLDCETGKADLKEELKKDLDLWDWKGSVEELMEFWFSGEAHVENDLMEYILELRKKGIKCYLTTNNEKYRCEYLWDVAGLKNIFDGMFPSCNLGHFKDEQEFWLEAPKKFPEIQKHEVLVLDDDMSNVESAKQFGFNAEFYNGFEDAKMVISEFYKL